jgi:hypothetical protein
MWVAECCPCFGTQLDWRNLNPQESEELARVRAYHEKMYPRHPTDPYGLQRMERVKTDIGAERLCNQVFRELGIGEPTRAELASREKRREEPTAEAHAPRDRQKRVSAAGGSRALPS